MNALLEAFLILLDRAHALVAEVVRELPEHALIRLGHHSLGKLCDHRNSLAADAGIG